jgi:actin-related protein
MICPNQTDIIESIVHLLRPYSNDIKQKLLKNIVICGGGS